MTTNEPEEPVETETELTQDEDDDLIPDEDSPAFEEQEYKGDFDPDEEVESDTSYDADEQGNLEAGPYAGMGTDGTEEGEDEE